MNVPSESNLLMSIVNIFFPEIAADIELRIQEQSVDSARWYIQGYCDSQYKNKKISDDDYAGIVRIIDLPKAAVERARNR